MALLQNLKIIKYRLTMRKALIQSSREELQICLEEVKKEIERRNKQK